MMAELPAVDFWVMSVGEVADNQPQEPHGP